MKNEDFNKKIRELLKEMLNEENITVNYFEERHDLCSDTFNISISCRFQESDYEKEN